MDRVVSMTVSGGLGNLPETTLVARQIYILQRALNRSKMFQIRQAST